MLRREPHRGVQVLVMTGADIVDTFRLRAALELEAIRIVIAAREVPDQATAAVKELSRLPARAPWREVVDADMRFHRAVIDATGSERIARTYAGVQSEIVMCMVNQRRCTTAPPRSRPSTRSCSSRSSPTISGAPRACFRAISPKPRSGSAKRPIPRPIPRRRRR